MICGEAMTMEDKQEKLDQLKQEYYKLQSECFDKLIEAVRIMANTQATKGIKQCHDTHLQGHLWKAIRQL